MLASNAKANQIFERASGSLSGNGGRSLESRKKRFQNGQDFIEPTWLISSGASVIYRLSTLKNWRALWRFLSRLCLSITRWIDLTIRSLDQECEIP